MAAVERRPRHPDVEQGQFFGEHGHVPFAQQPVQQAQATGRRPPACRPALVAASEAQVLPGEVAAADDRHRLSTERATGTRPRQARRALRRRRSSRDSRAEAPRRRRLARPATRLRRGSAASGFSGTRAFPCRAASRHTWAACGLGESAGTRPSADRPSRTATDQSDRSRRGRRRSRCDPPVAAYCSSRPRPSKRTVTVPGSRREQLRRRRFTQQGGQRRSARSRRDTRSRRPADARWADSARIGCGPRGPRRIADSRGRWRSPANALGRSARLAQRAHDALGLVGQHGGRFHQSGLGQEERSVGQAHHDEQSQPAATARQPRAAIGLHRAGRGPRRPPCWAKASRRPPAPRPTGRRRAARPPPHRPSRAAAADRAPGIAGSRVPGPASISGTIADGRSDRRIRARSRGTRAARTALCP